MGMCLADCSAPCTTCFIVSQFGVGTCLRHSCRRAASQLGPVLTSCAYHCLWSGKSFFFKRCFWGCFFKAGSARTAQNSPFQTQLPSSYSYPCLSFPCHWTACYHSPKHSLYFSIIHRDSTAPFITCSSSKTFSSASRRLQFFL